LSRSRRPLILAGVNVITNDAVDILRTFVQMTGIMVISTPRSKGIVDMRCPQSMFTAGFMVTDPHLLEALNNSDCIVTIGYDQRELPPERWNKRGSRDAPIIINIDCCTAEVEANFIPTVEVIGDIKQALTMMTQMLSEKTMEFKVPEFVQLRQMVKEHMEQQQLSNDTATGKLKPQKILNDIRQILDEDAILVSDVGQHMLYITRYYQCYHPRTCLIAGGFASMGFGLPGAIGAKLIYPNRQVVTICGDGGLLMSVQEMETAVRLKLNIVLLVWVDNEYGMISFEQEKEYHRTVFTKFGNPSFVELAKGFQWNSFYCDKSTEFSSIFKQALQMDGPSLIEIPIDYASQNKQLSSES
jgi:acetolactate synthase-1/2/3 large subunit